MPSLRDTLEQALVDTPVSYDRFREIVVRLLDAGAGRARRGAESRFADGAGGEAVAGTDRPMRHLCQCGGACPPLQAPASGQLEPDAGSAEVAGAELEPAAVGVNQIGHHGESESVTGRRLIQTHAPFEHA